jgi:DNA-binding XRE family transcriptional regulator
VIVVAKCDKRSDNVVRQHIINRRKELKITQDEVSKAVGIARSSYAAIERGLRSPSLKTAQLISIILKMDINEAFPINTQKHNERKDQ